jgi:hypothetical protein
VSRITSLSLSPLVCLGWGVDTGQVFDGAVALWTFFLVRALRWIITVPVILRSCIREVACTIELIILMFCGLLCFDLCRSSVATSLISQLVQ